MTYADLLKDILPQCRQCPKPVAQRAIARAARTLCRRTGIWRKELDPLDVAADQSTFYLVSLLPEHATILRLLTVEISDVVQDVSAYRLEDGDTLVFEDGYEPAAAATAGLVVTVRLLPDLVQDVLPQDLVIRWRDAIVELALADLFAMGGTPWGDAALLALHDAEATRQIGEARGETETQHRHGSLRAEPQEWL